MSHTKDGTIALDLHRLSYRTAGGAALLNDITLHLNRGEILSIVGLNGAGKTTLIRLLAGLIIPTRGAVSLHGRLALRSPSVAERVQGVRDQHRFRSPQCSMHHSASRP